MHLKRGDTHKESRSAKILFMFMIAEHVADVLTQETLDAFTKFLNAIHILLRHAPGSVFVVGRTRFEFLDPLFDLEVP